MNRSEYSIYSVKSYFSGSNRTLSHEEWRAKGNRLDLSDIKTNYQSGLMSCRNIFKILNHRQLLGEHQSIESQIMAAVGTELINDLYNGLVSYGYIIDKLQRCHADALRLLKEYCQVAHIELHPTDLCNLNCIGCTYSAHRSSTMFNPAGLSVLEDLNPKSIVLVGGGEPLLYRWNNYGGLVELVNDIIDVLPDCQVGLISNGTISLDMQLLNKLKWVRFSLDAGSSGLYKKVRGRDMFYQVLDNYFSALRRSSIPVMTSYLFSRKNINQAAQFVKYIYDRSIREIGSLERCAIQFRPLRMDMGVSSDVALMPEADQVAHEINKVLEYASNSYELYLFMKNHTNIEVIAGSHRKLEEKFTNCNYLTLSHIVRSSGEIRPCFCNLHDSKSKIADLTNWNIYEAALNKLAVKYFGTHDCSFGCRNTHLNHLLEHQPGDSEMQTLLGVAINKYGF